MNNTNPSPTWVESTFWGSFRACLVAPFHYPIQVIKIRQQCGFKNPDTAINTALKTIREHSSREFMRGFPPYLVQSGTKQIWCWPVMTELNRSLGRYPLTDFQIQTITGLTIAWIGATITTPLERLQILSAQNPKERFPLRKILRQGWQGYATNLTKGCAGWVAFITSQNYFKNPLNQRPTLSELIITGIKVSIVVSLATAPFDLASTLALANNTRARSLFERRNFRKLFLGAPLNMLGLIIQNTASAWLFAKLYTKKENNF